MDVRKSTLYNAVSREESFKDSPHLDEPEQARTLPRLRIPGRRFFWFLFGIIAVVLSFGSYRLYSARAIINQCGTTPAEARSKGCVFETMGFSWLPRECSNPTIEAEFLEFERTTLRYWRDQNYTEEVPLDEVQRGDGPIFFVHQDYHRAHCAFLFKKMHKAIGTGQKVDGLVSPFHHTSHCVHMLLAGNDLHLHDVQVAFVKFPYCGKDGGYNTEWAKQGQWLDE